MSNRWNSRALHEELATYYYQFRGITAPTNLYTNNLWAKIEEVEFSERG